MFLVLAVVGQGAQAQTFTLLHTFTGGLDGSNPSAGLTYKSGQLYGTAYAGGGAGYGTVYQLKHVGSGWTLNPLYSFSGNDGAVPSAPVVFGPDGALYSTAEFGGTAGKGNAFKLRPSPTACRTALCPWNETVLYNFQGGSDAAKPIGMIFNSAGNIYGTSSSGGAFGQGTVYQLSPSGSGWAESLLHSFGSGGDGINPYRSVLVFDNAGNLYGTTMTGGQYNAGTVFELSPSGSGWTETILYSFLGDADGRFPYSGLMIDQSGNLYGTTTDAGVSGGGVVFEMSPSGSGWTYNVLYSLSGPLGDSCGPAWALTTDAAGNMYNTTECDGANQLGNVFKLTKNGNSWSYSSLHDFSGASDGAFPLSNVTIDSSGNLYGTTYYGGANNDGVAWEITP